ncbi:MAG: ABC transporter substrate-binding protein, partial [Thermoplasmata archaeon]|nr:ABC transporter substrate-binding protein [Thermoplasmata archaeon]
MRYRELFTGLVILVMVLSAFAALPAKTVSAAADEDVFYIAMQEDMPDFNYFNLGSNSIWKYNVIGMGFEGLSTADFDLRPVPQLAESWDFDEDTLTIDVYLRQGVLFHDLTEMTAEDVKFTYMMLRDGSVYSDNIIPAFDANDDNVVSETELNDGITIVNDYELTIVMAKPYGQFFSSTLGVPIVPKHIWEDHVDSENRVIVTWGTDKIAATGTGPWYYADGVANSYRVMKKFDDYWGKDLTTPYGMPLFPNAVDTVFYKIYASIDTAILALQGGQVNYIAWAVTAGRVPGLQSDPNIELEYMSDAGYFYMAFNMKKEPMNNLSFRKAVSHLIDKEQLVDVYMGGFGQAGSAAVSPFFGEWHNPAVTKYAFDIDAANALLDEAGYDDQNGDGWRDLPDGRIMEKITLLTPPADYDPIRIRAGQMIASNMRAAGINVEAKPIDFNTLVAKSVAFDYQILIIGWNFSGYTECVSVLFDIYGTAAASNNWAFWSDTNPNPYYSDLGGVSTLADEATTDMADAFALLEDDARATFDVAKQIDYVKQGQEIIADAVPCNVLYYRVNVEAHDKVWANWTEFDGSMMNPYNLCTLEYSGTGGAEGGGAVTATLSAGLTVAGKVMCDESIDAYVKAIDNLGNPVVGADVEVDVTDGVAASPESGTTDEDGVFEFAVMGEAAGVSTVNVTVTSGALEATDSAGVIVSSLGGIAVQVMPAKTVLEADESTDVEVVVTDVEGDPVEGATVTIDPYLLGYGSISPEELTTGATGMGTMTYTAPANDLEHQHMLVTLAASVAHPKYSMTNLATSSIMVYNDAPPDWVITSIESVTTTALNSTDYNATISVLLTDDEGNPMGGETLDVVYSDESLVTSPDIEVTTAVDGTAELDIAMADTGASGALRVTIGMLSIANSITDTVTLTYVDPADPPADPMYGGYIQFDMEKFVDPLGSIDVTVHVFDSDGAPADGVNATVVAPATSYGQMMEWDDVEFNSLWEYVGISVTTEADGQSISTAGAFDSPFVGRAADYADFWYGDIPVGVVITAGVYEMTLNGVNLASLDLINSIHVLPGSWTTAEFDGDEDFGTRDDWGPWPLSFSIWGQTVISSSLAYGRAMELTTVAYEIDKPVLKAKDAEFDMTGVSVTAYDENNVPIEDADVTLYTLGDYGVVDEDGGPVVIDWAWGEATNASDADGTATFNVTAASQNSYADMEDFDVITRIFDGISREVNPDMYIVANVDGYMAL